MKDHEGFPRIDKLNGTFLAKAIRDYLTYSSEAFASCAAAAMARVTGNGGRCSKTNSDSSVGNKTYRRKQETANPCAGVFT
jgi:hypothetical protein